MFPHRFVAQAHRAQIIIREFLHRYASHVAPKPMRVHLVADNVIPDASMLVAAVSFREKLDARAQSPRALQGAGIERREMVRRARIVPRMEKYPVQRGIASRVI